MANQAVPGIDPFAVADAWLRRAGDVVTASRAALNTLNVFPISDADTGSNLNLTLRGIADAVPAINPASLDRAVQTAILSAHGNCGAIVAQMFSSVGRILALPRGTPGSPPAGVVVAVGMRTVADAATRAVARPVAGTILTVAADAATAAEQAAGVHPAGALAVARAAQRGARESLERTPQLLAVLDEAGVVDAGGQAFVLLVDVLVEVLGGEPAQPLLEVPTPRSHHAPGQSHDAPLEYEVMYALRGAAPEALDALGVRLSEVGRSVVIVGGEPVGQVHVHLLDAGAAIEAALAVGRLSQVRVTVLPAVVGDSDRTVLSLVAGPGLAEAVTSMGGTAIRCRGGPPGMVAELTTVIEQIGGDVVILPNDRESLEIATQLAVQLRVTGRRRIAVIPTVAQVQGLAAIAVHEPAADFDSAVVAMSRAAGHARQGAVTIAEGSAMTMAGRCAPGDVLGIVEGDFVEIGDVVVEVAWRVVERLLAAGGELLTLVGGAAAEPGLVDELRGRVMRTTTGVDVETLAGGQPRYLLLVGLE